MPVMTLSIPILMAAVLAAQDPLPRIEQETAKVAPAVTEIRHHLHQNPELSGISFSRARYRNIVTVPSHSKRASRAWNRRTIDSRLSCER